MLDLLGKEQDNIRYGTCLTGETRYTNINIKVELGAKVKTVSIRGIHNRD